MNFSWVPNTFNRFTWHDGLDGNPELLIIVITWVIHFVLQFNNVSINNVPYTCDIKNFSEQYYTSVVEGEQNHPTHVYEMHLN